MASLIENILSLEKTADEIVANTHIEAKAEEKKAATEIEAIRRDVEARIESRIVAFRQEAEAEHQQDVADAERASAEALAGLDGINEGMIRKQADRIVTRFRES